MVAHPAPEAAVSCLPRADGSARHSQAGFTITASVNGPLEAQRRDEHPYEAHVDVIVRPAAGVRGTRERHLESVLESSLADMILVQNFPRSLIQIVLQVESTPENVYANTKLVQASVNIALIPVLLRTAVLALMSAAVPMRTTATATLIAVTADADATKPMLVVEPTAFELDHARSVHALAFTSQGELVVAESEGDFSIELLDQICKVAQTICGPSTTRVDAIDTVLDEAQASAPDLHHFLRSTMEAKVREDLYWR